MSNMNKVLGIERINERVKRPNALINFIKPLEGPDKAISQDFLERVAAICYPIMKANHIAVMALEEFPANMEFVGRNFNAGEVIQLVLKAPRTGQWLPFKHVQMVMMHELAHCKQMNHSRAFWKVRNDYAEELKGLWGKSYTGEGLWGKGQSLATGRFMTNHMPEAADAPKSLCGGTYRSSGGRKRKRKEDKPKVTYAERQQRRIAKKFGVNGVALGYDEGVRAKLETGQKGKKPIGKPRVAKSNRGRELRAAAALARFKTVKKEAVKEESPSFKKEPFSDDDYETDSDDDSYSTGERNFNPESEHVVKVCENEDPKDDDAQRELDELLEIDREPSKSQGKHPVNPVKTEPDLAPLAVEDLSTDSENEIHGDPVATGEDNTQCNFDNLNQQKTNIPSSRAAHATNRSKEPLPQLGTNFPDGIPTDSEDNNDDIDEIASEPQTSCKASTTKPSQISELTPRSADTQSTPLQQSSCPICSLENEPNAAICVACSHVLDTRLMPNSWKCNSLACKGSAYVNPGDYGVCGVCGTSKAR